MKKQLSVTTVILITIIVAALGFFGGMQYTKMQRGAGRFGAQGFGQGGPGGGGKFFGNGNGGNRPVMGQVSSIDQKTITVKMPDGSSKIIILSSSTAINKQATGTKDDIKTGENILVIGTSNSDGSVTATNIQLHPMMRGMMRGQNATPSGQ